MSLSKVLHGSSSHAHNLHSTAKQTFLKAHVNGQTKCMSWVNLIWVSEKPIETFYCMGQRAGERKFCILINENGKMTYLNE